MDKAAERLDFERAAQLRDMLDDLTKTLQPDPPVHPRPRRPRESEPSMAWPTSGSSARNLSLERPPPVMECFDISNISTTHIVASMVRFTNGVPDNPNYRRYRIKIVEGQDDFASMAEVVRRRYSRILLEAREQAGAEDADATQESVYETMRRLERRPMLDAKQENPFVRLPDLVIVDGGKGQLSSATAELQRLGLHDLPIIGLAKQREEVFRPGEADPVVLPHDRGALKLLQRIRDEAHRFANGYHQLL